MFCWHRWKTDSYINYGSCLALRLQYCIKCGKHRAKTHYSSAATCAREDAYHGPRIIDWVESKTTITPMLQLEYKPENKAC